MKFRVKISADRDVPGALELAKGVEIVPAWLCVAGCVLRLEKAGDFFPQKNAKNDGFDASYWP